MMTCENTSSFISKQKCGTQPVSLRGRQNSRLLTDVAKDTLHKLPNLISFASHTKQKGLNIVV